LEKLNIEYVRDWINDNRPEFILCDDIYINAHEKLKFFHVVCEEYFVMQWYCVSNLNIGCPVCSGHQVGKRNSLAYLRPNLIREWHYCNSLEPTDVTVSSGRKAYWICSSCGYGENKEWFCRVNDRVRYGCPACSGRVVTDRNRLSIFYPELLLEWDYKRNKDTPDDVSCHSHKKRYWICKNGHSYSSIINSRTQNGSGCKKCSDKRGESVIASKLKEYFVSRYVCKTEYRIVKNPKTGRWMPYDIYIPCGENPKHNGIYIEIHGEQHYRINGWTKSLAKRRKTNPKEELKSQKERDKFKRKFAENNGTYIEIDLRKINTTEDAIKYIESFI